ncbi:hypothetical protein CK203_024147 [Vitis vinifera]|uniref:Uncharacterized protein n=1 Tax=Vitis vinifera TaxID=29760 RepID=A0A438I4U1_VITVI|nr:hypothetical protein CK203_024147 [Vitis vinifera]
MSILLARITCKWMYLLDITNLKASFHFPEFKSDALLNNLEESSTQKNHVNYGGDPVGGTGIKIRTRQPLQRQMLTTLSQPTLKEVGEGREHPPTSDGPEKESIVGATSRSVEDLKLRLRVNRDGESEGESDNFQVKPSAFLETVPARRGPSTLLVYTVSLSLVITLFLFLTGTGDTLGLTCCMDKTTHCICLDGLIQ